MAIGFWAQMLLGLYVTWRLTEMFLAAKEHPWTVTARRGLWTAADVGVILYGSVPLFFVNLIASVAWFLFSDAPDVSRFRRDNPRPVVALGLALAIGLEVGFYAAFQALR